MARGTLNEGRSARQTYMDGEEQRTSTTHHTATLMYRARHSKGHVHVDMLCAHLFPDLQRHGFTKICFVSKCPKLDDFPHMC